MTTVDVWFWSLDLVPGCQIQVPEREARAGLRAVLAGCLGVEPHEVRVVRAPCPRCGGPHGRPELDESHGGERRLRFSLSHCAGLAVVAVSLVAVGVDVEPLTARVDEADLVATLHPAESARFERLASASMGTDERRRALLGCWVRKEAYLKGLGIGLGLEPDAVRVGMPSTPPTELRPSNGPRGWTIVDLPAGPDHVAAVAVETTSSSTVDVRLRQRERQVDRRHDIQRT